MYGTTTFLVLKVMLFFHMTRYVLQMISSSTYFTVAFLCSTCTDLQLTSSRLVLSLCFVVACHNIVCIVLRGIWNQMERV